MATVVTASEKNSGRLAGRASGRRSTLVESTQMTLNALGDPRTTMLNSNDKSGHKTAQRQLARHKRWAVIRHACKYRYTHILRLGKNTCACTVTIASHLQINEG